MKYIFLCAAAILCLCSDVYAQDQVNDLDTQAASQWKIFQYTYSLSGFPVPKDMNRKAFAAETLYTNSPDEGDVAITCLREKLFIAIESKPIDFEAFVLEDQSSQRAKRRAVTLRIDGEKKSRNKWTYNLKHKIIMTNKSADIGKIYNAAITGKPATLQIGGGKAFDLNLPKPNGTFANFGAGCGIGRNK
jgi:hypothetical protein